MDFLELMATAVVYNTLFRLHMPITVLVNTEIRILGCRATMMPAVELQALAAMTAAVSAAIDAYSVPTEIE
jgi:hypothetical protein